VSLVYFSLNGMRKGVGIQIFHISKVIFTLS
jgi:hypothetical protein